MKKSDEIRREAWALLWREGWLSRFFAVLAVFWLVTLGASLLTQMLFSGDALEPLVTALEGESFADEEALRAFLADQAEALRRVAILLAWSAFVSLVLRGVFSLAFARLELRAARHAAQADWKKGLFAGFRAPLGMAWLWLCQQIRTWWVTGLFVMPALVLFYACLCAGSFRPALLMPLPLAGFSIRAFYRYRQAWYVKAAHEDWPAGRCLAESARLTDGAKMANFRLDCAYWGAIALLAGAGVVLALAPWMLPVSLPVAIVVPVYIGTGQAIFHRELLSRDRGRLATDESI